MSKALKMIELIENIAQEGEGDYEAYLSLAIAILDSEHTDYPEGVLEDFLHNYMLIIEDEIL